MQMYQDGLLIDSANISTIGNITTNIYLNNINLYPDFEESFFSLANPLLK